MTGKMLYGIGVAAIVLVLAFPLSLLGAIPVMVALGILHHQWRCIPAFGFWEVVVMLLALKVLIPYQTKVEDKS